MRSMSLWLESVSLMTEVTAAQVHFGCRKCIKIFQGVALRWPFEPPKCSLKTTFRIFCVVSSKSWYDSERTLGILTVYIHVLDFFSIFLSFLSFQRSCPGTTVVLVIKPQELPAALWSRVQTNVIVNPSITSQRNAEMSALVARKLPKHLFYSRKIQIDSLIKYSKNFCCGTILWHF